MIHSMRTTRYPQSGVSNSGAAASGSDLGAELIRLHLANDCLALAQGQFQFSQQRWKSIANSHPATYCICAVRTTSSLKWRLNSAAVRKSTRRPPSNSDNSMISNRLGSLRVFHGPLDPLTQKATVVERSSPGDQATTRFFKHTALPKLETSE